MIAWFNGELLPLDGVAIPATDRGFLLGDGFFETMAVNSGKIVRFDDHMKRLSDTADKLSLPLPYSVEEIQSGIHDVLVGNQLLKTRAAIRLTVTRGSGPRGLLPPLELKPQMLITAGEAPDHYPAASVKTVSVRRNEQSPTAGIKSLCYMDNIFAFEEAHKAGADEALMLNTAGHIAEGTITNIFFVKGDQLLTPKVSDGALPGTARSAVIKTAAEIGMVVSEESLTPDIITDCNEAFLTNSLCRVRVIHKLDGRQIPAQAWADKILDALKAGEST
ncbi:aminotransferase class IV [Terasakiella sp. A23]|uniref:aminotransferase class IV n=1 Tax=Terasakiella sp. FCG-A23 TaxID=3080561 RepID=UPI0029533C83|nr:aminotransferase class IV [Terasakiella sp. A23]MDV7341654.1 aminotransferase class IV [Terasakiella sp. A23]